MIYAMHQIQIAAIARHLEGSPWFEEYLAWRGVKIIYDIDDLIYIPRASAAGRATDRILMIVAVREISQICAVSEDAVTMC